jgi:hypothetical protein
VQRTYPRRTSVATLFTATYAKPNDEKHAYRRISLLVDINPRGTECGQTVFLNVFDLLQNLVLPDRGVSVFSLDNLRGSVFK